MKTVIFCFLFSLILPLVSREREALLSTFKQEVAEAGKIFQEAATTVELTAAAGNLWRVAENQYFQALDYKLRHTSDRNKRLELLKKSHLLSREIQKIYDTPREDNGSGIGMQMYHSIANLYQQQIAILMLDVEAEKRWNRIADATMVLDGKEIQLKHGKAKFETTMYSRKEMLEIILSPKDTFCFQNRDFAIIRTDIPFAGNDDFSSVYLLERQDGKMKVHTKCNFPFFSKWELNNSKLILHYDKNTQEIKLLP